MLIIGEKINILNRLVYEAISSKDMSSIMSLALLQVEAGADVLDVNLCPEITRGEKIMQEVVTFIAENTNDGIIAPLFYLILGGPILAVAYKVINTLDPMVGYKNDKYLDFGWFSAKSDDVANYIPARVSGFLISISSFIVGKGFKDSFKTMLRDSKKHSSPNSGISEAAMAGALGIRLGGGAFYQGKFVEKQYIGNDIKKVGAVREPPLLQF